MNLILAWRNVWRNKTRSFIILASVALGLFAGIFVLGLYEGMIRARVRTVIDTEVAHIQIHHPNFKDDYDPAFTIAGQAQVSGALRTVKDIKAVAYRSMTQGMLATATGSAGVQINGIIPDEENAVSSMKKKIIEGDELDLKKKNGILIGKKLADKMKLSIGNKLVLTFTDRENNITAGAFKVAGIYQTSNSPLDERNVFVNRATLNSYLLIGEACHEIAILLVNDTAVEGVKQSLQQRFPAYSIQTWRENSPETDLMVSTINQYSSIIIVIIMIALAFGIVNTMLMSVLERTREIGMLTALGMNRVKVFVLVLAETVILTLVGVPLGLLSAWITILYFSTAGIDISSFAGAAMSGFGFGSIIYPEFPIASLQTVMIIVVSTALISSLFPSMKAIKLQPADALRQ
ncbi:MAG: ABC transporter permease [Cyclobacteriaceae bacterium]|nr:ABC transporter permease [Cyclobacteriaceae bacterium]MDH4295155.1 ABC transporter permease [Cyclobacteriaceae bacterium]MDH5250355.1 ABC transporter permease [Cyclobacteriaceae bacterium]